MINPYALPVATAFLTATLSLTTAKTSSAQATPPAPTQRTGDADAYDADAYAPYPERVRFRRSVTLRPTRLVNFHFPEISVGYRQLIGPERRHALSVSGGLVVPPSRSREEFGDRAVIGFGLGGEVRRYAAAERRRPIETYFSLGLAMSRAYYQAPIGVADVPLADYARFTEVAAVSRRHEVSFAVGLELTSEYGFTLDFRPAVALLHMNWDSRGGGTAPLDEIIATTGGEGATAYVGQSLRSQLSLVPRMTLGIGWAW